MATYPIPPFTADVLRGISKEPTMNESLRLFDQFVRTDHRPAPNSEPGYGFWNRSAWPACENIRGVLEQWFASYPASH